MYYHDFWDELKRKTGSAQGFTGLSEVIVFIILKELIEREYGELNSTKYSEDTCYFHNSKFAIGRNLTVDISGTRVVPDIVIWRNPPKDKESIKKIPPDGAIEVKAYSVRGEKTIEETINRLKTLKNASESFRGMIIFYENPSNASKKKLREEEDDWLAYLILKQNYDDFVKKLREHFRI